MRLGHLIFLRYLFVGVQIVAVFAILALIIHRTVREPVAAQHLNANHKLTADDLRMSETEALVGRYLRMPVDAGKPVTAAMVSAQPLGTKPANTIAAVVTLSSATVKQRGIADGSSVIIRRATPPLDIAGKVVRQDCDDAACTLIVSLPKLPGQIIDPDAFVAADVVAAPPSKGP